MKDLLAAMPSSLTGHALEITPNESAAEALITKSAEDKADMDAEEFILAFRKALLEHGKKAGLLK